MLEVVLASLLPTLAILGLFFYLRRSIPDLVQNVLNDVGKQLEETFANPTIKKAYSILGSQSGEARASTALRTKVANKVLDQSPVIKKALDLLEIEPLEGLQLMNDPIFGPVIQGAIAKMQGGILGNPQSGGGGLP